MSLWIWYNLNPMWPVKSSHAIHANAAQPITSNFCLQFCWYSVLRRQSWRKTVQILCSFMIYCGPICLRLLQSFRPFLDHGLHIFSFNFFSLSFFFFAAFQFLSGVKLQRPFGQYLPIYYRLTHGPSSSKVPSHYFFEYKKVEVISTCNRPAY